MMKIKDLSNKEMKEICEKIKICANCPLARWQDVNGSKIRVICFLKARAIATASIQDYEKRKAASKDPIEQDYFEDRIKEEKKNWQERENEEFKL